jgi:hypothetical protein
LGAPFLHFSRLSFEEHHSSFIKVKNLNLFSSEMMHLYCFACWVHSYLAVSMDWPKRKLTGICSGFLTWYRNPHFSFRLSSSTHHISTQYEVSCLPHRLLLCFRNFAHPLTSSQDFV